jgi:hypothetical protein
MAPKSGALMSPPVSPTNSTVLRRSRGMPIVTSMSALRAAGASLSGLRVTGLRSKRRQQCARVATSLVMLSLFRPLESFSVNSPPLQFL